MKTLDQCDSRLCHSKYYFIFTFFGNLHVNNGDIVGKYFNRISKNLYCKLVLMLQQIQNIAKFSEEKEMKMKIIW